MLRLDDLGKTYADGTEALRGVTLTFEAGEIVALVGGSGCGKSTLIRLVAGLDKASSGRILLNGWTVDRPSPRIGVVFQEPRLLPWLDVAGNIGFGLEDLARAERRRRIDQALEAIGLVDSATRWPRDLSGGQRSASPWPGSSCGARMSCCSTNPFRPSTPSRVRPCRTMC